MSPLPTRCPVTAAPARAVPCPERPLCPVEPRALMPREGAERPRMPHGGAERAVMLALRFIAAARDTGDAACWDAAFDRAEAEFGPRDGALLVARAAALLRARRGGEAEIRFLPPPCRYLSADEAELLGALRTRLTGERGAAGELSGAMRAALADLERFRFERLRPDPSMRAVSSGWDREPVPSDPIRL